MNNFQQNQGWQSSGNSYGYVPPIQPSYQTQMQPQVTTNVALVTSLEEAKYRANGRNMDLVFFNQNKDEFYRIKVDSEGVKSWATFPFIAPNQPNATPVTYEDLAKLNERIMQLEAVVTQMQSMPKTAPRSGKKKVGEVIEDGELDG